MKLFLIGFLGAGLVLVAQTPQVTVRAGRETKPGNAVGTAVLGFFPGPGPAELNTIFGIFGAARVGEPVAVPQTVSRLYISPRQLYALVEQKDGGAPAILALDEAGTGTLVSITGAWPHADLVAFSPRGDSAALYAHDSGQIQVISGLPHKPVVQKMPPMESPAAIAMMAVTDDAAVLVARDSTGSVRISIGGGDWEPFYGAYFPSAWTFIPRTHDLVLSDSQEKAVFLVEQAGAKNTRVVLAEQCPADHLAVTGNGQTLVALDAGQNKLWIVDLKSRASKVATPALSLTSLTVLHSGNTFFAPSRDGNVALLKVSEGGAVETAAIPVATGR